MESIQPFSIERDVHVIGKEVSTFPNQIDEAFKSLISLLPDGNKRSYYGISYMKGSKMAYFATAEEQSRDEGKQYGLMEMLVPHGDYLSITVNDWQSKTHLIKDVFTTIIEHPDANRLAPAVEWYKNDNEMMCLVLKK